MSHGRAITICHPVWRLGGGGLERQLWNIVTHPSHRAIRHVLVIQNHRETNSHLNIPANVRIIPGTGARPDPIWSRRLALLLRQENVDVLHVRGLSMLFDCVMAAELVDGLPVVFSFHGFENFPVNWPAMRRQMYRGAIERCSEPWSVSHAAADALCEELDLQGLAFDVIPNGVDVTTYSPALDSAAARARLGLPPGRRVILTVGNYKTIKGHDVLLRSLAQLRAMAADFTLVLVGEDHLSGALQAWTARQLREFDVRFVETSSEPLPWYQAADIFALPSRFEGCSNALLEAMACGLPVVATAVGGNVEAVENEATGLLIPPEDPEAMGAALSQLLADADRRRSLGERARHRVLERFDADVTARTYAGRYMRLADGTRARSLCRTGD